MARDYRKLKVFALADELVADVYVATRCFPPEERIGLQAELRKAAVAVPSSIVIGCERSSESEYVHFNGVALSSASETRYLLEVAHRLGYLADETFREIEERYGRLVGGLHKLINAMRDGDRPREGGGETRRGGERSRDENRRSDNGTTRGSAERGRDATRTSDDAIERHNAARDRDDDREPRQERRHWQRNDRPARRRD